MATHMCSQMSRALASVRPHNACPSGVTAARSMTHVKLNTTAIHPQPRHLTSSKNAVKRTLRLTPFAEQRRKPLWNQMERDMLAACFFNIIFRHLCLI